MLDETGIPKKGTRSVGVHKQYCGALGKSENCQVATLVTYATARGHVFLDRRLFLAERVVLGPRSACQGESPRGGDFPDQARAGARDMLAHAWKLGVPMRWVTGDSVYGDSPTLRAAIEAHGCWYVLALTGVVRCWLNPPPLELPQAQTGGRPRRAVRLAPHAPKARTVAEVIARLPREQSKRLSVGVGTKGPRIYDWARVRVIESRDGFPGLEVWLLARRSVSDPKELTYYFALAPKTISLQQLAQVAGTRYTIEQVIKEAKSEVGFDRYEVRFWHSWYRHITLSMLAQVWLADQRQVEGEKNGPGGSLRARSAAPAAGGAAFSLRGVSASAWPGRIGAAANATGRGSATTAIAPGPSTPEPIRSIPPDLSGASAQFTHLMAAPRSPVGGVGDGAGGDRKRRGGDRRPRSRAPPPTAAQIASRSRNGGP